MSSAEGWEKLVRSIDDNRSAGARFYKPVMLAAAIDLADEGGLNPYDIDAGALLQRFDDYVRPIYPTRADSGWQPLWFLTNDGIWSFLRGGKVLTHRDIGRGQSAARQASKVADRMQINGAYMRRWEDDGKRAALRDQLVLMLANDKELSSQRFARTLFNKLFEKTTGRQPTDEEFGV